MEGMSTEEELRALKQRHAAELWKHPDVCGIDIADDAGGHPVFTVHVRKDSPEVRRALPRELEGHSVRVIESPIEKHRAG
jgi:hypothetical protein